jgi:hypothetical protein
VFLITVLVTLIALAAATWKAIRLNLNLKLHNNRIAKMLIKWHRFLNHPLTKFSNTAIKLHRVLVLVKDFG